MAVTAMKRLELYAMKKDRKAILELLQRRGVVDVQATEETAELFSRMDTSQTCQELEQNAQLLEQAAALLDQYVPVKKSLLSMLEGRPLISPEDYEKSGESAAEMLKTAKHLLELGKQITDSGAQVVRLEAQQESLEPWKALDIPLGWKGTGHTRAFIGTFPEERDEAGLKEDLARLLPQVDGLELEILSRQTQQTCIFLLSLKKDAPQVEEALRSLGFTYPAFTPELPPTQESERLAEEIRKCQKEAEEAKEAICSQAEKRDQLLLAADFCTCREEKYKVLGELWQSPHVFYLTGYLPAEDTPGLLGELDKRFTLWAEALEPGPQEEPPVKLKNGFFSAPMESVVAGYSLPKKGEVDPSQVMAVFYYVLYGMMLSDAAYGILMVLGCGLALSLKKFQNMEQSMRKTLRMFLFCGISTTVWGVLFGGYFGDAIPVIAETFFHKEITVPALWFEPLSDPMRLLIFSFGIGVLHLFAGLGVQFYQLAKQKKYADAIYDVIFWYLLVGGLIVVLLSTEIFQNIAELPFQVPGVVATAAGVLAGIGAVGILFTAGRESRNPVKRFLKGLYGLYGVSSYLSDILSYSRLLALGLATGVISTVFNQLGAMLGGGVVGAIFFIVVFLIGHTMNMAINVLGAYVHTNRLQFVEFFGKFYEGGGQAYAPFATNTKHFQIKEEK